MCGEANSPFLVYSGFQEGRGQKQGQQIISHSAHLWQEFCVYTDTWVCAIFQGGFTSIQMTPLAWFQMGQPTSSILIPTQCNYISVQLIPSSGSIGAFALDPITRVYSRLLAMEPFNEELLCAKPWAKHYITPLKPHSNQQDRYYCTQVTKKENL